MLHFILAGSKTEQKRFVSPMLIFMIMIQIGFAPSSNFVYAILNFIHMNFEQEMDYHE